MTFEFCIEHILKWEGGYTYDIRDPGGETSFGISKRAYPSVDIELLTKEGACAIYKRDYWDKMRCDELPSEIRLVVFSSAINQGVGNAIRTLQRIVHVDVDGKLGPKTLNALREVNPKSLKYEFLHVQCEQYFSYQRPEFLKGWILRLIDLSQY